MADEFIPSNQKEEVRFTRWDPLSKIKLDKVIEKKDQEKDFLAECEQLRQEAIQKGFDEGMANAQIEIEAKRQVLSEGAELLKNLVQLIDDKLIQEMIQTLVWLSAHCIGVELSVHPEQLRQLFAHIKNELPSLQADMLFAMHPDDVAWITQELGEREALDVHKILVADPSLSRGDFYLKGEHSELDGRVQTRLFTLFARYINKDNLITPIQPPG